MIVNFNAHRSCYRQVMEEIRNENPEETIEFDVTFSSNPNDMLCSQECDTFYDVARAFDKPAIRKDRRNAIQ